MIPKSGNRFSGKIMLKPKEIETYEDRGIGPAKIGKHHGR
jgi:hypothetical protein